MLETLVFIKNAMALLRNRLAVLRAEPEAGYTTETVVVTALLIVMALTVIGIIAAKVISTANNIQTGGAGG
jgi:hypothetical protein